MALASKTFMTRLILWAAATCACTVGCAASPAAERQKHIVVPPDTTEVSEGLGPDPERAHLAAACPMAVHGTDVLLVPIRGGSAFIFTTPLESPIEVRRRAWFFASLYDADGSLAPGLQRPEQSPAGFPTSAQYSEVAAGARVEIRPLSDENLPALRAHLQRQLEHMQMTQSC